MRFRYQSLWVFSAHAEVVPSDAFSLSIVVGILRARGGSSSGSCQNRMWNVYSPRTRR